MYEKHLDRMVTAKSMTGIFRSDTSENYRFIVSLQSCWHGLHATWHSSDMDESGFGMSLEIC